MCYSAAAISNFFIEKSQKLGKSISNMKLQKMIFFAHAAFFKQNQKPLFSDPVVAWQHGPVVESIYHALKKYGDGSVTEMITRFEPSNDDTFRGYHVVTPVVRNDDYEVVSFLNSAWEKLYPIDTWRLRMLSHAEGGAWYKTVQGQNIDPKDDDAVYQNLPRNLTILDSVIQECGR